MSDQLTSPWLTIKEACPVVKVGPKTLYREIKAGRLRAAIIGNRRDLRIHRTWLDEWLIASSTPVEIRAASKGWRRTSDGPEAA
jgi:excisionase family DNA binding protein